MNTKKILCGLILTAFAGAIPAAEITISKPFHYGQVMDQQGAGRGNLVRFSDTKYIAAGDTVANVLGCAVFIFELPAVKKGESVQNAEFSVFFQKIQGDAKGTMPNAQMDVFFKNTGVTSPEDYQVPAAASKLDFLTARSIANAYCVWSGKELAEAVAANYAGKEKPAKPFIVFRVRWQERDEALIKNGIVDLYSFGSADPKPPKLKITTAPDHN